MFIDTREALAAELEKLAATPELQLSHLQGFAAELSLSEQLLQELRQPDPCHPYGRNVVHACDRLECMVATWTRNHPCAPHDHGGSCGAVRILQGQAHHQIWQVQDTRLLEVRRHSVSPGEVLACGPFLVHSMSDDAGEDGLMTLHLYTAAIDHMVVYDTVHPTTHVVDGRCGAWIPTPDTGLLRSSTSGIHRRQDLVAA